MTETGTRHIIATSVFRLALGLGFVAIGAAKLTGSLHTVETFAAIGWGQWLRYGMGLVDIIGALLLLVPQWLAWSAAIHGRRS